MRKSDSRTSSKVDLNDSTNWVGSFRMNPTVSESKKGRFSMTTLRTVVSRVAKSLFSAKTSDLLKAFMIVDFPTFVYPTRETRIICPLFFRCVAICLSMVFNFFLRREILSRMIRRSVSISVSPGPFIPIPPFCFCKCVHIRVNRGKRYSY